ncbi:hypothetical protein [Alces alces faeces associated microvirus MP12 5423]|nr:hypothetical protein [Alces alces faeces associated microvirus MP12 5423]AXB22573.1 hypothetical protein [Alces alces faeces associated microvirus MP12 5423]
MAKKIRNKARDRRIFTRTASRMHKANRTPRFMRGGIRL